jgi:hypothetical protein
MPNALKQVLRRLRAHKPVRRRGRFELRPVDCLETRILPTAIVTFTGAAMTIKGDGGPNIISVVRVGTQVHVDGNGGNITVNGTDVPFFDFNLNGAFNLTATFQGGDDVLVVGGVGGGLQLKSATIKMGDGLANVVTITDTTISGKLTIDADDGADTVFLTNTSVTGTTLIDTGWNNDILAIVDGTYTGATTIKTDLGDDTVAIVGTLPNRAKFVGKLSVTTGDDVDTVTLASLDTKALSIDTGDEGDGVTVADILINGGFSVKTGAGVDTVLLTTIIQSGTGANVIDTGSGADVAVLALSSLSGATTINLGSGTANVLAIDDVFFNNTFTFTTKGTTDAILIEQAASPGATTFAKSAKFTFGIANVMVLSSAGNQTNFLSSVSFTGRSAITTIIQGPAVSFAIGPVTKNVLLV